MKFIQNTMMKIEGLMYRRQSTAALSKQDKWKQGSSFGKGKQMKKGVWCRIRHSRIDYQNSFKKSDGVNIIGVLIPDSRKSLSPVSSTSTFADMAARKMVRSFKSLI